MHADSPGAAALLRALAAQQGAAPAPAAAPAASERGAVLSLPAPAQPPPAPVPPGATYLFRRGWLHPLLEEEGRSGNFILVPDEEGLLPVTGDVAGLGTRFVHLPPDVSIEERRHQLRALGAVVGAASFGRVEDLTGKELTTKEGARAHFVMPNGLVLPAWDVNEHGGAWVSHYSLRPALG